MTEEISNVELENEDINEEDNNNEIASQGLEQEYLFINCKFNYGGRIKNYGFINLVIDIESESLIKTSALLTSDRELWGINLNISFFKKELDKFINNSTITEDDDLRLGIKESLDIEGLIEAEKDKEIEQIIRETIENIIQESATLDLIIERIKKEDLQVIYPELLAKKDELEARDNNNVVDETTNSGKLNIDIRLNCLPVISPVKGRKVTELNLGDEIVVKVSDDREVSKEIVSMLERNEAGDIVGGVYEINYNEELDRYNILVQFKSNIFGTLIVEPELKIKTNKTVGEELVSRDSNAIDLDQNIMIIGIFATIMIILIIIFAILFI